MEKMKNQSEEEDEDEDNGGQSEDPADKAKEREEEREEVEQEALDYSYEPEHEQPRLEPIKSTASRRSKLQREKSYDLSPFDLDRMNTRDTFLWEARRRARSSTGSHASKKSSR